MANSEHVEMLKRGVAAWNKWRQATQFRVDLSEADFRDANLIGADLDSADLSGANLSGATLAGANLIEAKLGGASLIGTDLSRAILRGATLVLVNAEKANFGGADLLGANLEEATLFGANLQGTNLHQANLIDADLGSANLTGARLWEVQRGGWHIEGVICQYAFWDRDRGEATKYGNGEFEILFAERSRVVIHYPGGMSPIDLLALPIILRNLQTEYPNSIIQLRSIQDASGGASVTITIADRIERSPEDFQQEFVRIQTKLECVVEERDYLRQRLEAVFAQGVLKVAEVLALPRQEVHIYRPTGLTAIEGYTTMSGDTYNLSGQAGAVGPGAHASNNTFQQIRGGLDLPKLAEELGLLRAAMKGEGTGTRGQDKAIGAVADAEEAATKGDGSAALRYLKGAGTWALGVAKDIGVEVAAEYLKKAI